MLPGSVADGIAVASPGDRLAQSIEHPAGEFAVTLDLDRWTAIPVVTRAGLLRTARVLFDGVAYGRRP